MFLKSIVLRDWKAYVNVRFDFPSPTKRKNIILIGAQNGYGKTSLFEAIVLGLFGKDGLPLIARAAFSEVGEERLATNYRSFLEKAINRNAVQNGRTSCSATLVFGMDEEDEELEIRRIWNFSDSGNFKPYDEEVQIFEGARRKPIGPHVLSGADRTDWYRDYIAKRFLPYYLAAFFLFDGEAVSSFAEREMSAQVRNGIQGLLGIPVLRELAMDLRNYAKQRRQQTPAGSDGTLARLEQERETMIENRKTAASRYAELEPLVHNFASEREQITRELESYGAGTQAQLQEQLSALTRHDAEAEKGQEKLHELLSGDVALALAGRILRENLISQLEGEQARETWEAGRAQGDKNLSRFIEMLGSQLNGINPPLQPNQSEAVRAAVSGSWEALWFPPPDNCASEYLHPVLTSTDRQRTVTKLNDVELLSASQVLALLESIAEHEDKAAKIKESIARLEGIAPQLDEKRERMKFLNGEIDKGNRELGSLRKELDGLEGQIDSKNKEISRLGAQMDQAQPSLRRATRADAVAAAIDEMVHMAVPSQISEIATEMTAAHKTMAHKKDLVHHIEIDDDCNVKLMNSHGRDVRDMDLSADEKQIFTQALISAVAHVSGRQFPMVIDTPLGRLDVDHRRGVLTHLAERGTQIILLSTNTEIVGDYYEMIKPHLLKEYVIKHEQIGGVGNSTPVEGYFETGGRA